MNIPTQKELDALTDDQVAEEVMVWTRVYRSSGLTKQERPLYKALMARWAEIEKKGKMK